MSVTENGNDWVSNSLDVLVFMLTFYTVTKTTCKVHTTSPQGASHIKFELSCGLDIQAAKAVRVTFADDGQEPFNVCGLALDQFVV